MRVLSWNLYQGRAKPPAGRPLFDEFAARLAGWEWDVALLQEVPSWWPADLARAAGAVQRCALTSRNQFQPVSGWIGARWPDLVKSWGGGSNAILVRGQGIEAHARRRLRVFKERRVMHGVLLSSGIWVVNLHATAHAPEKADAEHVVARATALRWAAGAPVVLGGDLNRRRVSLPDFTEVAGNDVDHLLVHGLEAAGEEELLEHEPLSDHAPIRVRLKRAG